MTNVYDTIQIIAAALHVKNGISETALYLGQFCQPGLWFIEAYGRCGLKPIKSNECALFSVSLRCVFFPYLRVPTVLLTNYQMLYREVVLILIDYAIFIDAWACALILLWER